MVDSSNTTNGSDIEIVELSYEEARSRLVEIVTRLEQGSISLEESLALWEQGEALARHCQSWLDGARKRLRAAQEQPYGASPTLDAPADSSILTGTPTATNPTNTPSDSSTANKPDSEDAL